MPDLEKAGRNRCRKPRRVCRKLCRRGRARRARPARPRNARGDQAPRSLPQRRLRCRTPVAGTELGATFIATRSAMVSAPTWARAEANPCGRRRPRRSETFESKRQSLNVFRGRRRVSRLRACWRENLSVLLLSRRFVGLRPGLYAARLNRGLFSAANASGSGPLVGRILANERRINNIP